MLFEANNKDPGPSNFVESRPGHRTNKLTGLSARGQPRAPYSRVVSMFIADGTACCIYRVPSQSDLDRQCL
jgi:hypothetical protein